MSRLLSRRSVQIGCIAWIVAALGLAAWAARPAGTVHFVPAEHRFAAALVPESEHNLSVTLKNGTGRVLNVMGAPSFCGPDGCATIAGLPQVVPSGGTCRIAVRFQAGGPGPFAHEVPVYTDCPGQPEVMMRIVGDVSKSPTISAVEAGIAQSVRGAKP